MGKATSPAAAVAAPVSARGLQHDVIAPAAEHTPVPGGPAPAVSRQPGRLQRSPVAERTQSRFCQS